MGRDSWKEVVDLPVGTVVYTFPELEEDVVERRENRFLVLMRSGRKCHLHDSGRLEELIYPGNRVLVRRKETGKTRCQIEASWAGEWVVTDSSIHSEIAKKFLRGLKPEYKFGDSRLDFGSPHTLVEVKGVTLVRDGVALFPDAPTERGRRHVEELVKGVREGRLSFLLFLVMRRAFCFSPNESDRGFATAFSSAVKEGVNVLVKLFSMRGRHVVYGGEIGLCRE
ncbi:DNA/RNA nuclease SfsA [Sulfuracidifex tepidarius]|uniref:Sugar fermentation stimulation protein homolog n=1 Tax=Sulfuracidifex tepidarius TaxID=1294262 RepID=A0A510DSY7_9CREN|nr:DNA/RNA nuclease SfsA [Sulfuracidifex tepidarius]BBG23281.1 Sugar fermentation stimulation protein [Sulfuracidifex tepidarius]BBG26033.1 Sugar fermentation stimulation protein [Sulfuracidifex tepidarius]